MEKNQSADRKRKCTNPVGTAPLIQIAEVNAEGPKSSKSSFSAFASTNQARPKTMEKISAACAMEWSIELEKGLRSKKPGRCVEVIEQIGYKLQQWSREPSITIPISDMYNLVPGEERLFANAILLRLADTFRCGDNHTRGYILKTFLLESKNLIKMGKRYDGILAKRRVPNYVELLKRIKTVFDTGDAEAKAVSLRLFGCCADLAKDSAEIRYVILLSLQSSNDSEIVRGLRTHLYGDAD